MSSLICLVLLLFLLVILARSFMSWMPGASSSSLGATLVRITEPVLSPVRRALPPVRIGAGALDLSPLVVTFAIFVLRALIC
jgi:YggT family protein